MNEIYRIKSTNKKKNPKSKISDISESVVEDKGEWEDDWKTKLLKHNDDDKDEKDKEKENDRLDN